MSQSVLGGGRDLLNRAWWWFWLALLVTCAFADQGGDSLLMGPKYAVKKDGRCWGLSSAWWCLSWGTAKVPAFEEEELALELEPPCETVHCYVRKGVDLTFETLGMFLDNPISLWTAGMKFLSTALIDKFPLIWKVAGIFMIVIVLNMMAFVYLRVADVFIRIWKFFKWICGWPLFALILSTMKCLYNFCVSIPKKAEEERKKKEKREREANAVWKSSSRLFKEIGDRLAEAEKRGVFEEQDKGSKEEVPKENEPVVTNCPHCGQKGHEGEVCQMRYEARWRRPYHGTRKQKKPQSGESAEGQPSASAKAKEGSSKVATVFVEDQTALHASVWINDVRIPRCLIDTGAEVNLISIKDAVKYGFSYDMGGIQKVKGFNGEVSAVDGTMMGSLRLGSCGEPKKVEFLVTSAATIPIIGYPTLSEMGIRVDCQERILFDEAGNIVRCSAVSALKN